MTNPFALPAGNPFTSGAGLGSSGVIQGQGDVGAMAQGLAGVLAQMQQQKENEFRMQQLQQQQAQQQALEQYYQGQTAIGNRELDLRAGEAQAKAAGQAQVGAAQRAALGQPQGQGLFSQVLQSGAQAVAPGISSVFTGVSDANMPAAVEGVGNAQKLNAGPELPVAGKEFEFMQHLAQVDPSGQAAKFFYDNWVKKQPGVVVNTGQKSENAFAVKMAEGDVAAQGEATKAAAQASSSFPSMKEAYGLIDRSITGLGAKQLLAISRVAGAAGYKPGKDIAADTQTLTKLLRDGVIAQLQTRALGSGTAVSDNDRNYMEQIQGADLSMQPGAIKKIIRINVGLGVEKMVSAKMLLEQQLQDHPESAGVLKGKIKMIDTRFTPIWKEYQNMLAQETKDEAASRMTAGPAADQLFPVR